MSPGGVLVAAGAGVAFIHAVLPDHWMPIAVVARAERWSWARTARISLITAVGHVLGSVGLGLAVMFIGAELNTVARVEGLAVGIVLIVTGVGYYLWSRRRRGLGHEAAHDSGFGEPGHPHPHSHFHPHPHPHPHRGRPAGRRNWGAAVLIPLGIAASPDIAILPVLLAASTIGLMLSVAVLLVFTGVTLAAMVGLTMAAAGGGQRLNWPWLEKNADAVTAAILVAVGLAALTPL